MPPIPSDKLPDSTLAMSLAPYEFISRRCRRYGTDVFQTRLLLRKAICLTGPRAAELFYDTSRFQRRGATPGPVKKTLFGEGGVQGLDDAAHRHRKQMFMSLMTPERIGALGELTARKLDEYAIRWSSMNEVVLYEELPEILTRSICAWSGVPLYESETSRRTLELKRLFDAAGSIGPRHGLSRLARKQAEQWTSEVIGQIRKGDLKLPDDSPARVIAEHRDLEGDLLSPHTAAVELLNVLRPTVAVSVYMAFVAHALQQYPECKRRILEDPTEYPHLFVQEVRRFYPFFPVVMARVRENFEWEGYRFPRGTETLLDIYGTNRDARTWEAPDEFRPERFRTWDGSPFNFIPQGGGDYYANHRCSGEWIALRLMEEATDFLTRRIDYDVPDQDLRVDLSRLPALPRSRMVLRNVRPTQGKPVIRKETVQVG